MKKALAMALTAVMGVTLVACGSGSGSGDGKDTKSEGVLTHAEYVAADLDTEVTVEAFVQDKQSWWDDKVTLYAQDADGAYFFYEMTCSEADYAKLTPGTKIKVTGVKAEWSGEVELASGATFEIEDGSTYVAEANDLTSALGNESELLKHQNEKVAFKGLTVEAIGQNDAGEDTAFFYNWDNSGAQGDDVYFAASLNGTTYTFTIESYLRDSSTDVYKTAESLNVGDTIDVEGFLYWYEGPNPQITAITVK